MMKGFRPGELYPITSSRNLAGLTHVELARIFLTAGIRFFQVREKELEDGPLLDILQQIRNLCADFGAQFIVNDRVDLALASQARGVHLGQTDLPVAFARGVLGEDAVIGLSTHTQDQFRRALEEPVDYIACGPVYSTTSKTSQYDPLGLDFLAWARAQTSLPIVAIGGITIARAGEVWSAGADSIAVISGIVDAVVPDEAIRSYMEQRSQ